jgi:hypothetical protein
MSTQFVQQSSIYATMSGVVGTWAQFAGGGPSRSMTKEYNGGDRNPVISTGRVEYADVTLTRPYDPDRDITAERQLRGLVSGRGRVTITRYTADQDDLVVDQTTYVGRIVSVSAPEGNAKAADAAMISVTVAIESVA